MEQNKKNLNAVEKALEILLAFQHERASWGVRELSAHLGFSPATVQRILQTLKEYSFVSQDPKSRQYQLGIIYYQFLHILQKTHPVTQAALPFMETLMLQTQETVHLNIIEGTDRVCVDTIESPQELKVSMPIGSRSPLYAGASSKCLLAFSPNDFVEAYLKNIRLLPLTDKTPTDVAALRRELATIREEGYAVSLGERNEGLGSLSAPILNHRNLLLATVSLAVPEIRFKDEAHRSFCLKKILHTAGELSKIMGFQHRKYGAGPHIRKKITVEEK
jgi:DNA-binding IclR family transcriptional regulator